MPIILGIFSGAVTNTPSLGAGQQILTDLGSNPAQVTLMGTGYAMAYPLGICGILLVMWLLRVGFRVMVEAEARQFDNSNGHHHEQLQTMNIKVDNPNLQGLAIQDVPMLNSDAIVCSRLKRGDTLMVPAPATLIQLGDYLHLVGVLWSLYYHYSAVDRRRTGANGRENELPDPVRHVGGFDDRPASAGLCQRVACHQWGIGALVCDCLSVSDVSAYYVAPVASGIIYRIIILFYASLFLIT